MQQSMWADACLALCDVDGRIVQVVFNVMMNGGVEAAPVTDKTGVFVSTTSASIFSPAEVPMYRHGDPRFYDLLNEIAALHSKKSHDYTPAENPLANFHRSERFGVAAWKGALVRIGDKLGRLEQLASGKEPANESMRDTLIDTAVYSLLCVLLLEDAK